MLFAPSQKPSTETKTNSQTRYFSSGLEKFLVINFSYIIKYFNKIFNYNLNIEERVIENVESLWILIEVKSKRRIEFKSIKLLYCFESLFFIALQMTHMPFPFLTFHAHRCFSRSKYHASEERNVSIGHRCAKIKK